MVKLARLTLGLDGPVVRSERGVPIGVIAAQLVD